MEILLQSGALSGDNFNRAQSLARQLNVSMAEIIVTKDMIDKRLINAALQAQSFVAEGILKPVQCAAAVKMCQQTGVELHEVLKDLPPDAPAAAPAPLQTAKDEGEKKGWIGNIWNKVTKKD